MLSQKSLTDARLVVEAMQRSLRCDLDQIAITFLVFGENQEMVVRVAIGRRALDAMIIFLANIKLAANDRLDPRSLRGIHKMHRAKNIAVVSHRHGRHTQLFYAMTKLLDVTSAVEHGVISME